MTYQDQIKSPKWQKKRLEVLEMHKFECENCGDTEATLNVHHPYYKKGKKIWEYEAHELQCLCENCHKEAHVLDDKIRFALSDLGYADRHRVLGYINAVHGDTKLEPETYEYCQGVADYVFVKGKLLLPTRNKFYDSVEYLLSHNDAMDCNTFYDKFFTGTEHA